MPKKDANHVIEKRGELWFRRRLPIDLADQIDGGDITRPLKTKNRREAERMARAYGKRLDTAFDMIRSGLADDVEDKRTWVRDFAAKALEAMQADVDDALADTLSSDDGDNMADAFSTAYMELVEPVHDGEEWALREAIRMSRQDPDDIPRNQWKLAAVTALRMVERLQFNPSSPPSLAPKPNSMSSRDLDDIRARMDEIASSVQAQSKAKDAKTFGEALELYAAIKAAMRRESIEDIQRNDLFGVPQRLGEHLGFDTPLDEVKVDDVLTWLDAQRDQRSRASKPISTGTRNRFVGSVSTFFDEAVKRGWSLSNPAKGLRQTRRTRSYERRQAFTTEELQRIFTPELRQEVERGFPERWWVPCIHLMNGTRTNEACQLRLRDIVEVDGILCFRILPEDAEQSTKTADSDRIVPIHPQLIELGFMDYVDERRRDAGDDPMALVFANLTYRKASGFKTKVVNHFAGAKGYLARAGVWTKDKKTLYSLRHNALTAMERAGVPDLARTQLTGHARQGDQGKLTYISDRQAHELLAELSKTDWRAALSNAVELAVK